MKNQKSSKNGRTLFDTFDAFLHDFLLPPVKGSEPYDAWKRRMEKREVLTSVIVSLITALIVTLKIMR